MGLWVMVKKQNAFRILKDSDYGYSQGSTIHVNIQRIWGETGNLRDFVREFNATHTHELLHVMLTPIRPKKLVGEEKVIRRLLNEPWTPSLEEFYIKDSRAESLKRLLRRKNKNKRKK